MQEHEVSFQRKLFISLFGAGVLIMPLLFWQFYNVAISPILSSPASKVEVNQSQVAGVKTVNEDYITVSDLLNKINLQGVFVFDLRDEFSFKEGHIKNSLSLPGNQFSNLITSSDWEDLMSYLFGKEVVIYCENNCEEEEIFNYFSKVTKTFYLEGGFDSWLEKEYPVESEIES